MRVVFQTYVVSLRGFRRIRHLVVYTLLHLLVVSRKFQMVLVVELGLKLGLRQELSLLLIETGHEKIPLPVIQ